VVDGPRTCVAGSCGSLRRTGVAEPCRPEESRYAEGEGGMWQPGSCRGTRSCALRWHYLPEITRPCLASVFADQFTIDKGPTGLLASAAENALSRLFDENGVCLRLSYGELERSHPLRTEPDRFVFRYDLDLVNGDTHPTEELAPMKPHTVLLGIAHFEFEINIQAHGPDSSLWGDDIRGSPHA
jgi:hypothetical protein